MARPRRLLNPPNPWQSTAIEWDVPMSSKLEVFEERAKSILSRNESPDIPFRYSLNPYRGCSHGCIYCYARSSHQLLGFGAGTDFDQKLVVKVNAPELLERRLGSPRWKREVIAFSGNTDCYQPLEASYELTRRCLVTCLARDTPVIVITKGTIVRRDAALLGALTERVGCRVHLSVAFSDDALRRVFDPCAPPTDARFETIRQLADAGVEVGVGIAPIFPGVNDAMIPEILQRAHRAGARSAFMTLGRLPTDVEPYFLERLREELPTMADKIERGLREVRGGRLNGARFGSRMRGRGARWDIITQLFDLHMSRLGMQKSEPPAAKERGQLRLLF